MNKIIPGTVIMYFLIIMNACNIVSKEGYSIDFIDNDKIENEKYRISIPLIAS